MIKNQNHHRTTVAQPLILRLVPVFIFLLITVSSCYKEEKLYGNWNLQTVLMNGEPLNDSLQFNVIPTYTYYNFSLLNILIVQTYALGEAITAPDGYYHFINNSTINMKYTLLYQKYDIDAKIKKLNGRELHLEYEDKGNIYFLKLYSRH